VKLPGVRLANLAGFLACAGLMAYALFAEYVLLLMPCPLCVFERLAVITLGIVFLGAAVQDPRALGRRIYAALVFFAAAGGAGVAAWHVYMQNLPPEEIPTCGPGLEFIWDTFPVMEALNMVFAGSGECADIVWSFLGLSMPAWVFISVGVIGIFGIWNNLRQDPRTADLF
jgi:disulfide bond formation protein DsbB